MEWFGPIAGVALAAIGMLVLGAAGARVAPDLFLLPVAVAARRGRTTLALLVAVVAGLAQDVLMVSERLLGLHVFTKAVLAYAFATLGTRTIVEKPHAVGALLGAGVLFEGGVLTLLLLVLRGELLLPAAGPLLLRALLTGALGATLHAAAAVPWRARWLARRRRRLS